MLNTLKDTLNLIQEDMRFRCEYEHKRLTLLQVIKFAFHPSTLVTFLFRWQKFFYEIKLTPIAGLLSWINLVLFNVDIDPRAHVGGGLLILHASCINIGPDVVVGKNCVMAHQNSISRSPFYAEGLRMDAHAPVLGDNVVMGGGAMIIGEVVIGNYVKVSMNSLVESSFPDHAVLFGVPAKNVAKSDLVESTQTSSGAEAT